MLYVDCVLDDKNKFNDLYGALDEDSWTRKMLQTNPTSLRSSEGESFFDEARLSAMASPKPASSSKGDGATNTADGGAAEEGESVDGANGGSPGGTGTANEPNVTIHRPGSGHAIPFTLPGPVVSELGLGRGSSVMVTISRLAAADVPAPADREGRDSESVTGSDRERDNAQGGDDADTGGGASDNG
ncbi:unnamed protein product, partial [Ectocarpus fasciculatus]